MVNLYQSVIPIFFFFLAKTSFIGVPRRGLLFRETGKCKEGKFDLLLNHPCLELPGDSTPGLGEQSSAPPCGRGGLSR